MNQYKITKNCVECNSTFESYIIDNRKFCSRSCSVTHSNKKRKDLKHCVNCGNEISWRTKYFCNKLCESQYHKNIVFKKIEYNEQVNEKQLKKYLIEKYSEKCMECNWAKRHPITKKIPIQLEHIDGNSDNNTISNCKLLCPNCHSLTPTYGALNKGNGRSIRKIKRNQKRKTIPGIFLI